MHLGFASAGVVGLGIWNSDHLVLKSSICSSALPHLTAVLLNIRINEYDEARKCDGMQEAQCPECSAISQLQTEMGFLKDICYSLYNNKNTFSASFGIFYVRTEI